jgi:hypothetical protein
MLKNYALSPQRRHSSGQPLDQQHMEEIAETGEPEEGELHHQQLRPAHFCNAAKAGETRVQKDDGALVISVPDPDPYVFGPRGSGSISTDPAPDPSLIKQK